MKKQLLLLFLASSFQILISQTNPNVNWSWEQIISSKGEAIGKRMAYDKYSNIYILGECSDTLIVAGDTVLGPCGIVLKLSQNGTPLWVRPVSANINEIKVSPDNKLYLSDGGTVFNDDGTTAPIFWASNNYNDLAFAVDSEAVAVRSENDLGSCWCTIASIEKTGSNPWGYTFQISNDPMNEYVLNCVDIDNIGNIYIAGNANGALDFISGNLTVVGSLPVVFIAKFDNNGQFLWVRNINENSVYGGTPMTTALDISVNDVTNTIGITGATFNKMVVGIDTLDITKNTSGFVLGSVPYIALFELNGNPKHVFSTVSNNKNFHSSGTYCGGTNLKILDSGIIYTMGYYNDTIVANFDTLIEDISIDNTFYIADDMYLIKADTSGAITNGYFLGSVGAQSNVYGAGDFDVDSAGTLSIVGLKYYSNKSTTATLTKNLYAASDYVLNTGVYENTSLLKNKLLIYPNPTNQFISINRDEANYEIFDVNGKKVLYGKVKKNRPINLKQLEEGIYFISLKETNEVSKFIIQKD